MDAVGHASMPSKQIRHSIGMTVLKIIFLIIRDKRSWVMGFDCAPQVLGNRQMCVWRCSTSVTTVCRKQVNVFGGPPQVVLHR